MNKIILVFSGFNQRAVITFLRCLDKNRIDNYHIIAASENDTILKTKYRHKVGYIRRIKQLDLPEIMSAVDGLLECSGAKTALIAPSTEALNRFLLQHRCIFEEHCCTIPLVEKNLYQTVSNKRSFWTLCRDRGMTVPNILELSDDYTVAFVAKPKKYFASDGNTYSPIIVQNESEYKDFLSKYPPDDFDIQEFIEGESFYLLYYLAKNGANYAFSQINYAQQPNGKSIVAAKACGLYQNDICKEYAVFLREIGFWGFIMVELRKQDNQYYMIEANPRFWGPSQLYADAGVPFIEYFLQEYGFLEHVVEKMPSLAARYFWSGGIKGSLPDGSDCVWHGDGKREVMENLSAFMAADIYNREDTLEIYHLEKRSIDMNIRDELIALYEKNSKHSNYQILASNLENVIKQDELHITSRYEKERLKYMKSHVDMRNKNCLDIGGNTGFFSLETINLGAAHTDYYEGNAEHAEFVKKSVEYLEFQSKVNVNNSYFDFKTFQRDYDLVLCLNVLHHVGDDYDNANDLTSAKREISRQLNSLSFHTKYMIFQLGFNWKGNRNLPLFNKGTKTEMIDFIKSATEGYWNILHIGIAERNDERIVYRDLSPQNRERNDLLGEFLNRPIFIMESISAK